MAVFEMDKCIKDFRADYYKYGPEDIHQQYKHLYRLADEYTSRAKKQERETPNRWILYLKVIVL